MVAPISEDVVVGRRECPVCGVGRGGSGDCTQLIPDDVVREVVHVEIVLVITERVFNLFTGYEEAKEDKARNGCSGDGDPFQGTPKLKWQGEAIKNGNRP